VNGYQWTNASGRFHTVLVLASDSQHAFEIITRDFYDSTLVRSTLEFARTHEGNILANKPLTILEGFHCQGWSFDTVIALSPETQEFDHTIDPDLYAATYIVYPAYRCEFSGRETLKEIMLRDAKMVDRSNFNREPAPAIKFRYVNTKSKGRSLGDKRGIEKSRVLFAEINKLENARASFVEFENYLGQVAKVTWDDGFVLWFDGTGNKRDLEELLAWVHVFILKGKAI